MKERLIIIIVALFSGLFITSAGFFIYQSTKKDSDVSSPKKVIKNQSKSPSTMESNNFVRITEPVDESITNKRTIQVKGTTDPKNTIIISTNLEDLTGKPTLDGTFAFTIDIAAGANIILTRSVNPNGDSVEDKRTITYSTEEF